MHQTTAHLELATSLTQCYILYNTLYPLQHKVNFPDTQVDYIFPCTCAKVLEYPGVGVIYSSKDMLYPVRDIIYPRMGIYY